MKEMRGIHKFTWLVPSAARCAALAVALGITTAAQAVTKPLAVWNGDFSTTAVRGTTYQFTPYAMGNTIADGIVTIASSGATGGFTVECSNYQNGSNYPSTPLMAVAGVSDIPETVANKTNALITAGWVIYNSSSYYRNRVGVLLNDQGEGGYGNYISCWNNNANSATPGNPAYDTSTTAYTPGSGTDYMALVYGGKGDTSVATKFYLNGSEVYAPSGLRSDKDNGWRSVSIGGPYGVAQSVGYHTAGMKVKYLALLNSSSADDVAYWSLTDMTSVENASGAITGGANVGVNLNGTAASVAAGTTAQAVFVQDDTTLSLAPADTAALAITKPFYVADGKTLTIKLTSLPESDGSYPLISYANAFVDGTEIALDLSAVTVPSGKFAVLNVGATALTLELSSSPTINVPGDWVLNIDDDYTFPSITVGGDLTITGSGTITVTGAFTLGGTLTVDSTVNLAFTTTTDTIQFPVGTAFAGLNIADVSKLYVTGAVTTDGTAFSWTKGTIPAPENNYIKTDTASTGNTSTRVSRVTTETGYAYIGGWQLYWAGTSGAQWDNKSNWRYADGSTPTGYPTDASNPGDHCYINNETSITTAHNVSVAALTVNANATFTGDSYYYGFNSLDGEGTVTMSGATFRNANKAASISADVCVTGDSNYIVLGEKKNAWDMFLSGSLSGTGTLNVNHGFGNNQGVADIGLKMSGDNSGFCGKIYDYNYYARSHTGLTTAQASSSNAVWEVSNSASKSNVDSYFPAYVDDWQYFGAVIGTMWLARADIVKIEVGARSDVESVLTPRVHTSYTGYTIRKVGSNILNLKYADGSNSKTKVASLEITDGMVVIDYDLVPDAISFTGNGGTLKYVAGADSEENPLYRDVSAKFTTSSAPVAFDTNGGTYIWGTQMPSTLTGGLTKKGAGTLTLTAIPQYSGATKVLAGKLVVPYGTKFDSLYVEDGASVEVDLTGVTDTGIILLSASVKTGSGSVSYTNVPEGYDVETINTSSGIIYANGTSTVTWTGEAEDLCWETAGNWDGNAAPTAIDKVVFSTADPVVTNSAAATCLSITASNGLAITNSYSITVLGDFTVTGAFVKSGKGTLTVEGTFGATGGTTVNNGAIEANLESAQTVAFDADSAYTYDEDMTEQAYWVNANNNFQGTPTTIGNGYGAKFVTPNANLLTVTGSGVVDADGAYAVTSGTFSGELTGTMDLTKTGDGTFTLFGNQTFDGDVTVSGGTLKLGTPLDLDGLRADYDASDANAFEYDEDGVTIVKWNPTAALSGFTVNLEKGYHETHYTDIVAPTRTTEDGYAVVQSDKFLMSEDYSDTKNSSYFARSFFFVAKTSGEGNFAGNWEFGAPSSPCRWRLSARNDHMMRVYGSGSSYDVSGLWYNGALAAQSNSYGGVPYPSSRAVVSAVGAGNILRDNTHDNRMFIGGQAVESWNEVLSYTRELDFDEKAAVEQYLMAKWGIDDATYAALPATADVTVAAGATLDLGGQTVTVAGLNLSGTIQNGTLIVEGEITLTGSPTLDATIIRAGDTESETIIVPGSTSATVYETKAAAETAKESYTIVLTNEQTTRGLQESYYKKTVASGETEGTYVVTVVLDASEVAPVVDTTSSEPMTVTSSEVSFAVDTKSLKKGLYYGVGTRDTPSGEVTYGGMTLFTGSNAGDINFTADLPDSGVLYYTIEASDTDLSPNP